MIFRCLVFVYVSLWLPKKKTQGSDKPTIIGKFGRDFFLNIHPLKAQTWYSRIRFLLNDEELLDAMTSKTYQAQRDHTSLLKKISIDKHQRLLPIQLIGLFQQDISAKETKQKTNQNIFFPFISDQEQTNSTEYRDKANHMINSKRVYE